MDNSDIQVRLIISGQVQGVGFRYSTREAASLRDPNLKGYVQNLKDGRVEAVFYGDQESVAWMVSWCHHGPPSARVTNVIARREKPDSDLTVFEPPRSMTAWPTLKFW